jgi:hypothetical protein
MLSRPTRSFISQALTADAVPVTYVADLTVRPHICPIYITPVRHPIYFSSRIFLSGIQDTLKAAWQRF